MAITRVKIFPSIGIARVGNSPDDFFIGPELPGVVSPPAGGYKDSSCRIKRQAARFRIFGYDENDRLEKELTLEDAAITWTVHLANTKASWRMFGGLRGFTPWRNPGVADRTRLEIDPGPRTLDGSDQAEAFDTGGFLSVPVPLGEMRTDSAGRLLVLGGFGRSGSVPAGRPLLSFGDNDGWHDDVSDGPITATVTLKGSRTPLTASPAWVLCAPPDFAPAIQSVTTLYDVLFQVAVDNGWLAIPARPSFTRDIFPILNRVHALAPVSDLAARAHGGFTGDALSAATAEARRSIFSRVRDPNHPNGPPQANMPRLYDDQDGTRHTITRVQYAILEKWKDGVFIDDWTGEPAPPATVITPEGLTRAALEACVGAALSPGIEAGWFLRDTYRYTEPFRLSHTGRAAGDVTKQLAVPWQADFVECASVGGYAWWPAQRPDVATPEGGRPVSWTRGLIRPMRTAGDLPGAHRDMVENWYRLGYVVEQDGEMVETERDGCP